MLHILNEISPFSSPAAALAHAAHARLGFLTIERQVARHELRAEGLPAKVRRHEGHPATVLDAARAYREFRGRHPSEAATVGDFSISSTVAVAAPKVLKAPAIIAARPKRPTPRALKAKIKAFEVEFRCFEQDLQDLGDTPLNILAEISDIERDLEFLKGKILPHIHDRLVIYCAKLKSARGYAQEGYYAASRVANFIESAVAELKELHG